MRSDLSSMGGPELRRAEQTALVNRIERGVRKEVERARDPEVDAMVLENLAFEVADVDRHRLGAERDKQPAHPRLELHAGAARNR